MYEVNAFPLEEGAVSIYARRSQQLQEAFLGEETTISIQQEQELIRARIAGTIVAEQLARLGQADDLGSLKHADLTSQIEAGWLARNTLVECHLSVALGLAREFADRFLNSDDGKAEISSSLTEDDLLQLANLELVRLADIFSTDYPDRYQAVAKRRIRDVLNKAIATSGFGGLDVPYSIIETYQNSQQHPQNYSTEQLEQLEIDISRQISSSLEVFKTGLFALEETEDDSIETVSPLAVADILPTLPYTQTGHDIVKVVVQQALPTIYSRVFKRLKPQQLIVITELFGLRDDRPKTHDEVANMIGTATSRVGQIRNKAMSILRHPSVSQSLREHLLNDSEPASENNLWGTQPTPDSPWTGLLHTTKTTELRRQLRYAVSSPEISVPAKSSEPHSDPSAGAATPLPSITPDTSKQPAVESPNYKSQPPPSRSGFVRRFLGRNNSS